MKCLTMTLLFTCLLTCAGLNCQEPQSLPVDGLTGTNDNAGPQGVTGMAAPDMSITGTSGPSGCTGSRWVSMTAEQEECIARLREHLKKACLAESGDIDAKRCAALKLVSLPVSLDRFQFDFPEGISEEMKADLFKLDAEIKDICLRNASHQTEDQSTELKKTASNNPIETCILAVVVPMLLMSVGGLMGVSVWWLKTCCEPEH